MSTTGEDESIAFMREVLIILLPGKFNSYNIRDIERIEILEEICFGCLITNIRDVKFVCSFSIEVQTIRNRGILSLRILKNNIISNTITMNSISDFFSFES